MMTWLYFALGSAFFSGLTSVIAKCGLRHTNSNLATALRTVVVLFCACAMVILSGSQREILNLSVKTWSFLVLSGLATGASWICYFYALQNGDINKVVPIDKSSTVMTVLLASILLDEPLGLKGLICIALIAVGTLLMIKSHTKSKHALHSNAWLIFALLSAVFASLTSILAKIGIEGVESNLGTAIRTAVVLIMSLIFVLFFNAHGHTSATSYLDLLFIILSGLATGASWLCFYRALQEGPASIVVPVDKMSILVSIILSYLIFKETLSIRSLTGLVLIIIGTVLLCLNSYT